MGEQTTKFRLQSFSTSTILALLLNTVEFLAGVIVIGLSSANFSATSGDHSAAVYVIIVTLFSIATVPALSFFTLSPPSHRVWIVFVVLWQWILAVLWAAAAGVLGGEANSNGNGGLRAGMVIALVGMVAWLVGAVMGAIGCCCAGRGGRKLAGFDDR